MDDWIILLIASIINLVFSLFIIFIYIKSKFFHSYAFYFNLLFSIVICFRNGFRLIPRDRGEGDESSGFCYFQAFILSVFDKLIQVQITSYSIINYIGMFKNEFFRNNEKYIFIVLTLISFVYSLILSIIYILQGLSHETYACYVTTSSLVKQILGTISSSLLLLINILCTARIIFTLCKNKSKASDIQKSSINLHLCRFIFEIILVAFMFLFIICIINKIFTSDEQKDIRDIIFEIILLVMEIFYCMNKEFIKETKRIVTCQKVNDTAKEEDKEAAEEFQDYNKGNNPSSQQLIIEQES